jgi:hypothetical protein
MGHAKGYDFVSAAEVRRSHDFWIISLRHLDGKITNWTVDAKAENYSYVCQH